MYFNTQYPLEDIRRSVRRPVSYKILWHLTITQVRAVLNTVSFTAGHWVLSSRFGVTVADKHKHFVKIIARKSLRISCIKKKSFLRKRKFSSCLCVTRDLACKTHKSPSSCFYIINSSTKLRSISLGSLPSPWGWLWAFGYHDPACG